MARAEDWIFPALREAGILLMRGFPMERYLGQMFGNLLDPAVHLNIYQAHPARALGIEPALIAERRDLETGLPQSPKHAPTLAIGNADSVDFNQGIGCWDMSGARSHM